MSSRWRSSHAPKAASLPVFLTARVTEELLDLIVTPGAGVTALPSFGRAPRRAISAKSRSRRSSDERSGSSFERNENAALAVTFFAMKASASAVHFGRPDFWAAPMASPTSSGTFSVTLVRWGQSGR